MLSGVAGDDKEEESNPDASQQRHATNNMNSLPGSRIEEFAPRRESV